MWGERLSKAMFYTMHIYIQLAIHTHTDRVIHAHIHTETRTHSAKSSHHKFKKPNHIYCRSENIK